MTRRQIHQAIATAATLVFFACAVYEVLTARRMTVFLTICGAYVAFLLVCWLNVPAALRHRPKMPAEFRAFRLGPISPRGETILSGFSLTQDQVFKGKRHRLFELEQAFPEGTWRCQVEEVAGKAVACSNKFTSASSPVLDMGKEEGTGRFIATPGQG